jgi:hypothetical protein
MMPPVSRREQAISMSFLPISSLFNKLIVKVELQGPIRPYFGEKVFREV